MAAVSSTAQVTPRNEEALELGNSLFQLLDQDGTGGLSKAQLNAALAAFNSLLASNCQIFTSDTFGKQRRTRVNRAEFLQVLQKEYRKWKDPLKFNGALKAHLLLLQVHQRSGGVDLVRCPSSARLAHEVFGLMDMNGDGTITQHELAHFTYNLSHWAGSTAFQALDLHFKEKQQVENSSLDGVLPEGAAELISFEDFLEALQTPFQKLGKKNFEKALKDQLTAWRKTQQRRLKVRKDLEAAQALCTKLDAGMQRRCSSAPPVSPSKRHPRPSDDWGTLVMLIFGLLDGDSSGFLEPEEFRRVCEMVSAYAVEDMCFGGPVLADESCFSAMDTNGDSKVDSLEFRAYLDQARAAFGPRQIMVSVRGLLGALWAQIVSRDEASEHLDTFLEEESVNGTCSHELRSLTEAALQARGDHAHTYEAIFSLIARCHSLGLPGELWRSALEAMRCCEPSKAEHVTLELKRCSRRNWLPARGSPDTEVLERLAQELPGATVSISKGAIEAVAGAGLGPEANNFFLNVQPKSKIPDGSHVVTDSRRDGGGLRVTLQAKTTEPGLHVIKEACRVQKPSSATHVLGCSEFLEVILPHRSLAVNGRLSEAAMHLLLSEDGSGLAPVSLLDELGEKLEKQGGCQVTVLAVPYWMQALLHSGWGGEGLDLAAGRRCFSHDLNRRGCALDLSDPYEVTPPAKTAKSHSTGQRHREAGVDHVTPLRNALDLFDSTDTIAAYDAHGLAWLESRLDLLLNRLDQKAGTPSATAVRKALCFTDGVSGLACLGKILKKMPSAGDHVDVLSALGSNWPYQQKRAALEALKARGWCFEGAIVESLQKYRYDTVSLLLEVGVGESSYAPLKRAGFDQLSGRDGLTSQNGAAALGDHDAVRAILAKGMHPDVRDGRGLSAVHHAAMNGHVEVLHELLEAKADVHARDNMQRTPLHYATPAAARELVRRGGSPAALDSNGETPLVAARRKAAAFGLSDGLLPMPGVQWSEVEAAVALENLHDRVDRLIILGFGSLDAQILHESGSPAASDKLQLRNHLLGHDASERGTLLCRQLLIPLLELAGAQKLEGQLGKFCHYLLLHSVLAFAPVEAVHAAKEANAELAKLLDMEYAKDENHCLRTLSAAPTELTGRGKKWKILHQREATGEPSWLATGSDLGGVIELFHLGAFRTVEDLCDWGNAGPWSTERQYVRYLRQLAQMANDSLQEKAAALLGPGHIAGPVKGDARMTAKQEDYLEVTCKQYGPKATPQRAGGIVDVVRFSVSCASPEDMTTAYRRLMSCELERDGLEVVRMKNGFHEAAQAQMGYRDIKLNILAPVPGQEGCCVIGECQLLLQSFLRIKHFQHVLYEVIRGDCLDERTRKGIQIHQTLDGRGSQSLLEAVKEAYASLRSEQEEDLCKEVLRRLEEAADADWAESKRALAQIAEEEKDNVLKQLDDEAAAAKKASETYNGTGPSFDLWLQSVGDEALSRVLERVESLPPSQQTAAAVAPSVKTGTSRGSKSDQLGSTKRGNSLPPTAAGKRTSEHVDEASSTTKKKPGAAAAKALPPRLPSGPRKKTLQLHVD